MQMVIFYAYDTPLTQVMSRLQSACKVLQSSLQVLQTCTQCKYTNMCFIPPKKNIIPLYIILPSVHKMVLKLKLFNPTNTWKFVMCML